MKKSLLLQLLLFVAAIVPAQANPTTIVDSLTFNADYNDHTDVFMAQQFTTDLNSYGLAAVELLLFTQSFDPSSGFSVNLYADNSGAVGALIGNFSYQSQDPFTAFWNSQPQLTKVNYTSSLVLDANTSYWIGASNSAGYDWWNVYSYPGPLTSGVGSFGDSTTGAIADYPMAMRVTATSVPEPSTYAFMGLGALALVIAVRRRTA